MLSENDRSLQESHCKEGFFCNKIWQDNTGERHGEVIGKPSGHEGGPGEMHIGCSIQQVEAPVF